MRRSSRSLVIAVALVAMIVLPASAQTDARRAPRVSGPLDSVLRRCQQQSQRFNGRVVARARSCVRFYAMRTQAETSQRRNYGVIWLQTELDTVPNWCATRARNEIAIPRNARALAHVPRLARTSRPRRHVVRLRVDANGNAKRIGRVAQSFRLFPRVLRGGMAEPRTFRTSWRGRTPRTLAFASGVEVSWPADSRPGRISTGLTFRLLRAAGC